MLSLTLDVFSWRHSQSTLNHLYGTEIQTLKILLLYWREQIQCLVSIVTEVLQ